MEAAATGAEPQPELRAHLGVCPACRVLFAEEQTLFSSIDAGLQVTANSSVPASFLPRVRSRVAEESAPRRKWTTPGFALACAAAIVLAFFGAQVVRRMTVVQTPVDTAMNANSHARVITPPPDQDSVPSLPPGGNSDSRHQRSAIRNIPPSEASVRGKSFPEVLVPRDQEVLLALYAEQSRHRKQLTLMADSPDETTLAPLQVAPIQIAQLDVKLLAEEHGQ
jgi:hypothetical protein